VYGGPLRQEIEQRLRELCLQITTFFFSASSEENEATTFAKFSQLPQKIQERQHETEENRAAVRQLRQEILQKSWAYYNVTGTFCRYVDLL